MNSRPLFNIICKLKNDNFKTPDFSPLIKRVITGVMTCNMMPLQTLSNKSLVHLIPLRIKSQVRSMVK